MTKKQRIIEFIARNPGRFQHEIARSLGFRNSAVIGGFIAQLKVEGRIKQVNGGFVLR